VKKRWVILLIALPLGVVAVCIVWFSAPRDLPRSFVLPDSNRVTLIAVTVGTNGTMHFGSPLERLLARLPGKFGKRFQRNVVDALGATSGWTNIVFWFSYDFPPPPDSSIEVEMPASVRRFRSASRTLANGKTVCYAGTPLWPRRGKELTANVTEFRDGIAYHRLGEITISNPYYRKYPQWTAEPLPATRRFGNVSFTLDQVREMSPIRIGVTSDNQPETTWEAWIHQFRDATGNCYPLWDRGFAPARELPDDRGRVTLPVLSFGSPEEKALKLAVQFVRTGRIGSNEVFVLRGVPAAPATRSQTGEWSTNLACGLIVLRYHPDWSDRTNRPCLTTFHPDRLDLGSSTRNPPCVVILAAINDRGERIEPINQTKIHIPPGSKTLDITIAAPLQYLVEYTVDAELFLRGWKRATNATNRR
jgi:hypothetical protein